MGCLSFRNRDLDLQGWWGTQLGNYFQNLRPKKRMLDWIILIVMFDECEWSELTEMKQTGVIRIDQTVKILFDHEKKNSIKLYYILVIVLSEAVVNVCSNECCSD